ncbi:MAG: DNA-binding protein, partial [Caulobacteraceae bacterium]|nr:DNA-binding protein [Caulobacteraceae bacterium]
VAAEHLGVTTRAVRKWLDAGKLKGSKLGRVWRIRPEDVDAFVAANSNVGDNVVTLADEKKKAAR